MAIHKLHIKNFRGIDESIDVDIKPITIFVGPNSSGKSSCIHALACLSQTMKVVADDRPLILDDETASVHLGRFIEVIHSKSYQDQIGLGVSLKNVSVLNLGIKRSGGKNEFEQEIINGELRANYSFKCKKRTQEVTLESFNYTIAGRSTGGKRSENRYNITFMSGRRVNVNSVGLFDQGFLINDSALTVAGIEQPDFSPFDSVSLKSAQTEIQSELIKTLYLGPFRKPPSRRYESRGAAPSEVGPMGESTITMLANESIQSTSRPHISVIAGWLAHMKLAKGIDVSRIGSSDLFKVKLTLSDGDKFPIADLGYGLSQVLPVLTQCSFAPKGSTLLFEQPELHVHPLAAKGLVQVFLDTVKTKAANICLETHSPELVKAFFNSVRKGTLDKDDLQVYVVSRRGKKTKLKKVVVDEYGDNYENWEKDLSFI